MPEPEPIEVARGLRLRGYDGEADVDAAWPWYQDLDTVRLVDGDGAQPYSRDTVRSMYEALSGKGDVFMIEQLSKADTTVPVRILRQLQGVDPARWSGGE